MEKSKQNLKVMSILIMALTAFSCVKMIVNLCMGGLKVDKVPEGMTEGLVMVSLVIGVVFSFALLLPQVYVGIKGMKFAETPDSSKAHIVWAIVLAILAGVSTVSAISGMTQSGKLVSSLLNIVDSGLDVVVFIIYAVEAKRIVLKA